MSVPGSSFLYMIACHQCSIRSLQFLLAWLKKKLEYNIAKICFYLPWGLKQWDMSSPALSKSVQIYHWQEFAIKKSLTRIHRMLFSGNSPKLWCFQFQEIVVEGIVNNVRRYCQQCQKVLSAMSESTVSNVRRYCQQCQKVLSAMSEGIVSNVTTILL